MKLSRLRQIIKEEASSGRPIQKGDWVKMINEPKNVGRITQTYHDGNKKQVAVVNLGSASREPVPLDDLILATDEEIKTALASNERDRSMMAKMIDTSKEGT